MVGAMGGGFVADKIGRKRGLIVSQITGLLGGIIMAISKPTSSWEVLLVGRLVVGLTAGLNTVLVPMYVSGIAPVDLRGGLGVFNQLAVTSGIFLGQILGLSEVLGNDSGWPWLLAVTIIPCVVLHLSQQFSGMVAIFYYAVNFFESAGISSDNAKYGNLGVGAIMVTMTVVTIPLMDRLGRRVLHMVG